MRYNYPNMNDRHKAYSLKMTNSNKNWWIKLTSSKDNSYFLIMDGEDKMYKLAKNKERKTKDLDKVNVLRMKRGKFWLQIRISKRDGRTIFICFLIIDKDQLVIWKD